MNYTKNEVSEGGKEGGEEREEEAGAAREGDGIPRSLEMPGERGINSAEVSIACEEAQSAADTAGAPPPALAVEGALSLPSAPTMERFAVEEEFRGDGTGGDAGQWEGFGLPGRTEWFDPSPTAEAEEQETDVQRDPSDIQERVEETASQPAPLPPRKKRGEKDRPGKQLNRRMDRRFCGPADSRPGTWLEEEDPAITVQEMECTPVQPRKRKGASPLSPVEEQGDTSGADAGPSASSTSRRNRAQRVIISDDSEEDLPLSARVAGAAQEFRHPQEQEDTLVISSGEEEDVSGEKYKKGKIKGKPARKLIVAKRKRRRQVKGATR